MTPQPQGPSNILGISAKSIHRPLNQGLADAERRDAAIAAKAHRFELQRTAQGLLYDPAKDAGDQRRVCWCHRHIRTRGDSVGVFRADEGQGARFSGVATCGSVWHCPICAGKITEARRKELSLALTGWVNHGGLVNLMTLTFPHERSMPLGELLTKFAKALQSFKNSKAYKAIMTDAGRAGSIRSLETTWGENGWHPHTHDLVFLTRELTTTEVDTLKAKWVHACVKSGLCDGSDAKRGDMMNHGLDWADGRYAAEYIAKFGHDAAWGASAEMTKPHSKVGKVGEFGGTDHYTPFQLLAWAHGGDEKAAALFREFADAFEGKRMLSWSPSVKKDGKVIRMGLREILTGFEHELTDEQLAAHDDPAPGEVRMGDLDQDQYAILLSRNRLGDFLAYVARCVSDLDTAQTDIDHYVDAIRALPPTHSGRYLKKAFRGGFTQELHNNG